MTVVGERNIQGKHGAKVAMAIDPNFLLLR